MLPISCETEHASSTVGRSATLVKSCSLEIEMCAKDEVQHLWNMFQGLRKPNCAPPESNPGKSMRNMMFTVLDTLCAQERMITEILD